MSSTISINVVGGYGGSPPSSPGSTPTPSAQSPPSSIPSAVPGGNGNNTPPANAGGGNASPVSSFANNVVVANAALNVLVKAFEYGKEEMMKLGREIKEYSGQIQAAEAQADIITMQAKQKADQAIGDDIARMTILQARSEAALIEIRTTLLEIASPLIEFLQGMLTQTLESIAATAKGFGDEWKVTQAGWETIFSWIQNKVNGNEEDWEITLKQIRDRLAAALDPAKNGPQGFETFLNTPLPDSKSDKRGPSPFNISGF